MSEITPGTYTRLHEIVFSGYYPGYIPEVTEAPHGDGNWDEGKRYAHIALKYLATYDDQGADEMYRMLGEWTRDARMVAATVGLPPEFWPTIEDANIRLLEYAPGAGSAPHTDFDLFTLPMWRNLKSHFRYTEPACADPILDEVCDYAPGIHFGELMPIINPKAFKATEHKVLASSRWQYSMVYFAMPPLQETLPSGLKVADWLAERKQRSRKYT
jgi:isopenicillin N synthase-like dioxygenase